MSNRIVVPEHLLGDHRDNTWDDMSQYLVHFTKDSATLGAILGTGHLRASGPFGFSHFRKIPELRPRHQSVCFSEVPLDQLARLSRRHGHYGIGFTKDFVRRNHGARIWYLDQGSPQARALASHLKALAGAGDFSDPMWTVTPFIDLVMPGRYEWDWEREWRVRDGVRFDLADVAFVVTPDGIEELPTVAGLHLDSDHDLVVTASSPTLEEFIQGLVQKFFQTFEDPANSLPVDSGEYVWIVTEWPTEDAVDELFFEVISEIRAQLVDYLNGVSWSWVRSDDVARIYE